MRSWTLVAEVDGAWVRYAKWFKTAGGALLASLELEQYADQPAWQIAHASARYPTGKEPTHAHRRQHIGPGRVPHRRGYGRTDRLVPQPLVTTAHPIDLPIYT